MPDAYYPKANRTAQWFGGKYPGVDMGGVNKVLLHTTETTGWPGYGGGASAPTLTYDPRTRQWRQHFRLDRSARALRNSGSGQTNRQRVVQIEIIAYSDEEIGRRVGGTVVSALSDAAYRDLADFLAFMHREYGVPLVAVKTWLKYPSSYGATSARLSWSQYVSFRGMLGHSHAPGNTHGDPSHIDAARIIRLASGSQQLPDTGDEDDMPFTDWPKKDREALAKAVADEVLSRKNSTSDRNIMFHTRRGDNATAHFESLVSGNDISLATSVRHAQAKATEARNVLASRITSPISQNDISLRSMWSYQYRDINRGRDEAKAGFKAVQGEIAQVKATLAAQGALLKQVLERPGQPIDMKAIESAALAGAQEALRELDVTVSIGAADEPEIPDPEVDVITDGSDEPELDEDDA